METYITGFLVALKGLPMTLFVSFLAVLIGSIFGLLLALMKLSTHKISQIISKAYIEVVRGTPLLVQALIFAYGIPIFLQSIGIGFKWPFLLIPAIIVCGANSAAYMAEVMRGGIQSVDVGQLEAAYSLGMTKKQANKHVILPQAFKIVLPSLGNEFVTLIKETSVLAYVGVIEVLRSAQLWNAATFETFAAYIGAALVYLVVTYPLSKVVSSIERKLSEGAV